jgi:hypothetical protein
MKTTTILLLFTWYSVSSLKSETSYRKVLSPVSIARLFPRPNPGSLQLRGGSVSGASSNGASEDVKKKNGPKKGSTADTSPDDPRNNSTRPDSGKSGKWDLHLSLFQKLMSMGSAGENVVRTMEENYSEDMLQDWNTFVDSTLAPLEKVKGSNARVKLYPLFVGDLGRMQRKTIARVTTDEDVYLRSCTQYAYVHVT